MSNREVFFEKYCDTYKKKIEALIEFENKEIEDLNIEESEKKHTLTLLLSELCRMEEYCEDPKLFEDIFKELQDKVESIIYVLKTFETRINDLKQQEEKLEKTRRSIENKKKNLSNYLIQSLRGSHFQKFCTRNYNISFRKSERLNIIDPNELNIDHNMINELIRSKYLHVTTGLRWEKNKIKEDLKQEKLPEYLKNLTILETNLDLSYRERKD